MRGTELENAHLKKESNRNGKMLEDSFPGAPPPVPHDYSTRQTCTPTLQVLPTPEPGKGGKMTLTILLGHFHSSKWGNVPTILNPTVIFTCFIAGNVQTWHQLFVLLYSFCYAKLYYYIFLQVSVYYFTVWLQWGWWQNV